MSGPQQDSTRGGERAREATGLLERRSDVASPPLPPFNVMLHNDHVHDMLYVVRALVELTPLNPDRASEVMLRAHTRGIARVLTTHKERAELYRDQLRSKGLRASIQPGTV